MTRAFVLELAAKTGIRAFEETLRDEDLAAADEMFFTSTTREIVPVVRVDDRVDRHRQAGPGDAAAARRLRGGAAVGLTYCGGGAAALGLRRPRPA